MALGEQFENTYWFDDDNNLNASLVRSIPAVPHDEAGASSTTLGRGLFSSTHNAVIYNEGNSDKTISEFTGSVFDEIPPRVIERKQTERKEGNTTYIDFEDVMGGGRVGEERPFLQGMLFNPYTATGLKQDQLVPEGAREDAARRALKMEDTPESLETYKAAVEKEGFGVIGDKAAKAHQQLAVDALVNSSMPIHEMGRMAELGTASTIVKPVKGRASYDSGAGDAGRIIVNRNTTTRNETVESPATIKHTTTPGGGAIHNSKFWDWYDKNRDDTYLLDESSVETILRPEKRYSHNLAASWGHRETGETIPDVKDRNELLDFLGLSRTYTTTNPYSGNTIEHTTGDDEILKEIRKQGYVPNIYPGSPRDSKKPIHTTVGEMTAGHNARGDYRDLKMHTRETPGSVESVEVPGGTVTKKVTKHSVTGGSNTLVHEMGHAKDAIRLRGPDRNYHLGGVFIQNRMGWKPYGYADPIAEGAADGYADMYGDDSSSQRLQSAITRPDFAGVNYTRRPGYSTEYGNWKTDTHRAIYAAIRAHVGSGGSFDDIPDREALLQDKPLNLQQRVDDAEQKYRETTKSVDRFGRVYRSDVPKSHAIMDATLGHIWENMPHVRGHLTELGYHRVAIKAAEENAMHRAASQPEQPTQLSLFDE